MRAALLPFLALRLLAQAPPLPVPCPASAPPQAPVPFLVSAPPLAPDPPLPGPSRATAQPPAPAAATAPPATATAPPAASTVPPVASTAPPVASTAPPATSTVPPATRPVSAPAAPARADDPGADPLLVPPAMLQFVREATSHAKTLPGKMQGLLTATFSTAEHGGLAVQYSNDRTRTVAEVWQERRANCLSLTAFFVAACRSQGIDARYAEALNTNRWRKSGGVIRFERHVVALVPVPPVDDLVADFIPTLRKRAGVYVVARLSEARFLALFHSNRAVELMDEGQPEAALARARVSLEVDPHSSVAWNILGVVQKAGGEAAEAERSFRQSLLQDPADGAALGNLEGLLRESGRFEEARHYREIGETVRQKDPYFNAYLGEDALVAGDLEEAHRRIQTALRILPRESEFHLLDARLQLARGRIPEAIECLKLAQRWADPGQRERFENKLDLIRGLGQTAPEKAP